MKIGITMFPTDYAVPPHELAVEAEARGFESLWFPEHSHIPTSRKSPWPGGAELPKWYYDTYDPFVAMGAAAVVTKKIKLGTGVCLVIQRDPIHTAKEVSTVDRLSNGRLLFGIGGGWNAEEMADHGTAFGTRFKLMRERIEAMKAIWGNSKPKYSGEMVKFDEMMQWPKPVQKPHPPIIVGGGFPQADRRPRRRYAGHAAAVPRHAEGGRPRRGGRAGDAVRCRHGWRGSEARARCRRRPRRVRRAAPGKGQGPAAARQGRRPHARDVRRFLFAATRRAASSARRAHATSSSGSSNSRSGARQKARSMVLPFFS